MAENAEAGLHVASTMTRNYVRSHQHLTNPLFSCRRKLLRRLQIFRYAIDGLVVANLAVLGASVSTNPFNVVWQLLYIAYALTGAAAVCLATWLLVLLPLHDAACAAKVCAAHKWRGVRVV